MKKLINIALLKVKIQLKDRTAFAWMFLAPMIFIIILMFGFGSGGEAKTSKYPVDLVNKDGGLYSVQLINMLKTENTFEIIEKEYTEAKKAIENSTTAIAIVIPEGFTKAIEMGENTELQVLKLRENENTIATTEAINNYLYQLKLGKKSGDAAAETLLSLKLIQVAEEENVKRTVEKSFLTNMTNPSIGYQINNLVKNEKTGFDELSYSAVGIIIIFIMYVVTRGAGSMLEEKELGTWNRIVSTPTKAYNVLGGFILGTFILGWIQVGILIITSKFLFHVNWGNSIFALIILFSSFLLAIIGFGVALSSIIKSKTQLSSVSAIIIMPTCLLAGCMWPRDIMPDIMIKISNFVPQTWVLTGMTDLVTRDSGISAVFIPSVVLIIFTIIFFIIGMILMKVKKDN